MQACCTVTEINPWISDIPVDDPCPPYEGPDISLGSVPRLLAW